MISFTAPSVNEVQIALCKRLVEAGGDVNPRGMHTREVLGGCFVLSHPRNRLTTLGPRKWSAALAVAELAWNLRGDADVSALEFYAPRWREFANGTGKIEGSCYGARIFGIGSQGVSQWMAVKRLLMKDPSSRRAVLNFRVDEDVSRDSNDISCTNTIQFLLRENRLHAFINMRSNDVIWGVPYDVFLFSCLQELMAIELGAELGSYCHFSASIHVYARHFALAEELANESTNDSGEMPRMTSVDAVMKMAHREAELRSAKATQRFPSGSFESTCMRLLTSHRAYAEAA